MTQAGRILSSYKGFDSIVARSHTLARKLNKRKCGKVEAIFPDRSFILFDLATEEAIEGIKHG